MKAVEEYWLSVHVHAPTRDICFIIYFNMGQEISSFYKSFMARLWPNK